MNKSIYKYCKTCGMPIHNEDGFCWAHKKTGGNK